MTLLDPFDLRLVHSCGGLLQEFNAAGVLAPADVHVAARLGRLARVSDETVLLAAALAVRAPRLGHVFVDLARIESTAAVEAEEPVSLASLPWPAPDSWVERVAASPLVGLDGAGDRPLRLIGTWLYLDRYWNEERAIAADLRAMSSQPADGVSLETLADGLSRLFAGQVGGRQSLAAASAVLRRVSVVAGGPGTGKTTTVARIVALLAEQAAGMRPPLIALAAPTGKAAARLEEAVHEEAARLPVSASVRSLLNSLRASTIHRLLGTRPGSNSRFRHDRNQRLPHDVVIVDETSMVSLSLMARLIEAMRPEARLVLVGDPAQLASIEAGAVLGDIVGPAADRLMMDREAREALSTATGALVDAHDPPPGIAIGNGIVTLERVHRFRGHIASLASAVRRGDVSSVLSVLEGEHEDVSWIPVDDVSAETLAPVREPAVAAGRAVHSAAAAGDARGALRALGSFRVLCAHRRGPYGVSTWNARAESWLDVSDDHWYVGRPLLVTENDYELQLYNGDTGVIVAREEPAAPAAAVAREEPAPPAAAFERGGEIVQYSPTRLSAIETVYAMTIHKSQGSQFDVAAVLLPEPDSRILSRELLYTAVTRARDRLIVVGAEEAIRAAVERPVARASGLRPRLWD